MHSLAEFFHTNQVIVYFVYGEAFFVLGLAIAIQSRTHSQLALARRLWLLATFGIVHAVYEWGAVFIPIQQTYLPAGIISILRVLQLLLGTVSFLALFQFGVELLILSARRLRLLSVLPTAVFMLWGLAIFVGEATFHTTLDDVLVSGDVLARYGLALPGAIAAGVGLLWQARQVGEMDLPRIARYFRAAAFAFFGYAGMSAFVPRDDFFPASVFNYDIVLETVGVPVPVFRAILGAAIAYLIIRGSEIFDVETDRILEEVAQARAVSADRERIGRELHDGIIQSLYAAGLMLEDASLTIGENATGAQERIRDVIDALNRSIRDIRRYILDLRSETNTGDLAASLEQIVHNFRLETLIDAEFRTEGTRRTTVTREEEDQLLTIAREALTNVSKHARATRVDIVLTYRAKQVELDIEDNGIGFSRNGHSTWTEGEHQGLRNMQERADLVGAQLAVDSGPGQGTRIRVIVPLPTVQVPPGDRRSNHS